MTPLELTLLAVLAVIAAIGIAYYWALRGSGDREGR